LAQEDADGPFVRILHPPQHHRQFHREPLEVRYRVERRAKAPIVDVALFINEAMYADTPACFAY
jgi:hypothetical protein